MVLSCLSPLFRFALPALLAAGLASAAMAQEKRSDEGGLRLTFGLTQGLHWKDNPDLSIPASGSRTSSRTGLRFGMITETRTQRLEFALDGTLVGSIGETTSAQQDKGLISPSTSLVYQLESAGSLLVLDAFLHENDVSTLDFVGGRDAAGSSAPIMVSGTGTRRLTGGGGKLTFGRDAAFGGSVALNLSETDYRDSNDPGLVDNRRDRARLDLRLDLSETTSSSLSLEGARLIEIGATAVSSHGLTFGLSRAVSDGTYGVTLASDSGKEGHRQTLQFNRVLALREGRLALSLGASQPAAGETEMVGGIDWHQDLPRGTLSMSLQRVLSVSERDEEIRVSRMRLSLTQSLSAKMGLGLSANFQDSQTTATRRESRRGSLSVTLRNELSQDWGLDIGATHRLLESSNIGTARSNTVFINISRDFEFRP